LGVQEADVVVIGAGIAGCADAFFLAREGFDVLVVDRAKQPGALTTARSAACFRAQASMDDFARLVRPSIEFYENFTSATGLASWDIGLRRQGWLFLTGDDTGPGRCAAFVDANRRLGVDDCEFLRPEDVLTRFPWASERVTAGTFRADDGWISPHEALTGFLTASRARTSLETSVTSIVLKDGRVTGVSTDKGFIRAGAVVIACGPFSGVMAATANSIMAVLPIRRQLAFVSECPDVSAAGPMVADADTHSYWRPEGSGALLSVTRREQPTEPQLDPPADWSYAAEAMEANSRLAPFWKKIAGSLSSENVRIIAGQYSCTVDGRPHIGALEPRGLYAHTGDNGWGVESAPEAALLLAESVRTQGESDRGSPFSPRRIPVPREVGLASNWP
jgi:glycine/D-amino acid oxidase-like deaminating enzyme